MTRFAKSAMSMQVGLIKLFSGAQVDLQTTLTRLDPWDAGFADRAWSQLAQAGEQLWLNLRHLMPGFSDKSVLQQTWAACLSNQLHIGLLYRAALTQPALHQEVRRLHKIAIERWHSLPAGRRDWRQRGLVSFLMADSPQKAGMPDLGLLTHYRGSIRLRYRVAHERAKGAGLATLLKAAAEQPAATAYQRRVEFARALRHSMGQGQVWRPLNELSFSLMDRSACKLALSLPHLWSQIFTKALASRNDLHAHLLALIEEREQIDQELQRLMEHVRARRFPQLDALIAKLPDTPLVQALGRRLKREPWGLELDYSHPALQPAFGNWVPLSRASFDRLQSWLPFELPVWWTLSASDFAKAICQGQIGPDDIKWVLNMLQDLAPMRRTWTDAEQQALIRGGHPRLPDLSAPAWAGLSLAELASAARDETGVVFGPLARRLESLPNAAPWLALMASAQTPQETKELRDAAKLSMYVRWGGRSDANWTSWIASSYGTAGWDQIESIALEGSLPVHEAVAMFRAGRQPIDPEAFRKVVARSLHQARYSSGRPLIHIKRWLEHDPQAAQSLLLHGPAIWVERLVSNTSTPLAAIDVLLASESLSPVLQRRAWRNRLARTGAAPELVRLSAQIPKRPGSVAGLSHWLSARSGPEQNHAQVLVRRRDGHHLMDLGQRLSEPDFSTACLKAAQVLRSQAEAQAAAPSRLRIEAAALELLAHLGAAAAPALVQSLGLRHAPNAAGCKFDAAYSEHRIPKKNGGERLICAPHRSLRNLQAVVLQKLLTPLGAHPAACGFVPGRSVVDNARPHVGQAVVVNADIRNCFPSVRWPLVLGVLRRELGSKFSPAAISLLVDLCTARGVLPVGAPTSPALLNLVLRRTDEVLQQAADQANVRYTRYADDLTFSGGRQAVGLLRLAERTLAQIGLELDPVKTNIFRRGRRQMVTGLVVNQQVSVPRSVRRRLRAAVHHAETGEPWHWNGEPEGVHELRGRLAFVRMVRAQQAQPLIDRLHRACTEMVTIGEQPDTAPHLAGPQP